MELDKEIKLLLNIDISKNIKFALRIVGSGGVEVPSSFILGYQNLKSILIY